MPTFRIACAQRTVCPHGGSIKSMTAPGMQGKGLVEGGGQKSRVGTRLDSAAEGGQGV